MGWARSVSSKFDDLRFFHNLIGLPSETLMLFPEWETLPYESTPPHVESIGRRMRGEPGLTLELHELIVEPRLHLGQALEGLGDTGRGGGG